jgi:hypothetical protein
MSTIIINGQKFEVNSGSRIDISGNSIIIDGNKKNFDDVILNISIEGNLQSISSKRSIHISGGNAGNVNANGSVTCENVIGSIDAGGSVTCNDVGGDVDAGGSVRCNNVGGNIDAGGSVKHG